MKTIFELDEQDIVETLKNYYKSFAVNVKDVKLVHYTETEDYGMGEHEVPRVRIEVTEEREF